MKIYYGKNFSLVINEERFICEDGRKITTFGEYESVKQLPRVTITGSYIEQDVYAFGVSICNPVDEYTKKVGRANAAAKMHLTPIVRFDGGLNQEFKYENGDIKNEVFTFIAEAIEVLVLNDFSNFKLDRKYIEEQLVSIIKDKYGITLQNPGWTKSEVVSGILNSGVNNMRKQEFSEPAKNIEQRNIEEINKIINLIFN